MMDYHFLLAGLRITLRTPYKITVSESLQPFACCAHEKSDCTIELRSSAQLPVFSENGLWHSLEYYDCHMGKMRIFHCHAPRSAAFSVTQFLEDGNVEILALPEYLSYFTGTAGIFNRIGLETLLLQHKGVLLHASLIQYHGKAIALAGPSGVGKSTQANIWHASLGADIINGDRAVVRKGSDGWIAYGSPYAGTSGIYKNESAPLAGIILLRQGEENSLRRLNLTEAFSFIYPELSVHQWDKKFVAKATDLCLALLTDVPVYLLECLPEESAALLVKKGLGL